MRTKYLDKRIAEGDEVEIRYVHGLKRRATLLHRPQGEGDVFEFLAPGGIPFILNLYAGTIEEVILMKRRE